MLTAQVQALSQDGTGSGSQPRVPVPTWWPRLNNKPVTHVYCTMRHDMDDMVCEMETLEKMMGYERGSNIFISETLKAVRDGSCYRSPFLHTSLSLDKIRWYMRLTHDALAAQIDIMAWYQSGDMPEGAIIDLSAPGPQRKFVLGSSGLLGFESPTIADTDVQEVIRFTRLAKEVLLCWRGMVPSKYFEVINVFNGEVLGKLDDVRASSNLARSQGTQGSDACSSFEYPSGPPVALSPGFQSAAVILGAKAKDMAKPQDKAKPDGKPTRRVPTQSKLERIVEGGSSDEVGSSDEAEDGRADSLVVMPVQWGEDEMPVQWGAVSRVHFLMQYKAMCETGSSSSAA